MDRARQKPVAVFPREDRHEDGDPAHVEPAVCEHLQQDGVPPRGPGHANPAEGLTLGEVQDPGAVDEHGRAGVAGVEAAEVHLGDVRDERGLDAAGPVGDVGEAGNEIVVGE